MRWLALLLALGLLACDGETPVPGAPLGWGPASSTLYTPPAGAGGILGDWFFCRDESCATLTGDGLRFASDGTFAGLMAYADSFEAGGEFCVYESGHQYSWDGVTLILRGVLESGDLVCRATLYGDRATLDCGQAQTTLQRVTGVDDGPCPIYAGAPGG